MRKSVFAVFLMTALCGALPARAQDADEEHADADPETTAKEGGMTKHSTTHKATTTRRSRAATRDPRGGLTAAGRRVFERKEGAHLRPGVKKPVREMTVDEMRRKGSWAVRFYGIAAKGRRLLALAKKETA